MSPKKFFHSSLVPKDFRIIKKICSDTRYEVGSDKNGLACPEEINAALDSTGCSLDICKCNMQFADAIVAQLENYSDENTHSSGFDKETVCQARQGFLKK